MQVLPNKEDWRLARAVYRRFKAKPGSDHIATKFALAHLAAVVRTNRIDTVLEFGAGIGTITALLLETLPAKATIVCAERNAWCREQFELNVKSERVSLLPLARPQLDETFDLVVIDGPVSDGADFVHEGSVVFAEGSRRETISELNDKLHAKNLDCALTNYRKLVGYRLRWRMTRFGFQRPYKIVPVRLKGCWIGRVERATAP